jgi:hypothetical protein
MNDVFEVTVEEAAYSTMPHIHCIEGSAAYESDE